MTRTEEDRTPTYEGRPLARPDEELVDQGLGFDLDTLVGRRLVLRRPRRSAPPPWASRPAATTRATAASTPSRRVGHATAADRRDPGRDGGPVPRRRVERARTCSTESGVVRSDIRSSFGGSSGTAEGVPMTLELVVQDLANGGAPFAGAAVYVWHCDREGRYSLYSDGVTDENYLRGVQVADAAGRVRFTSIFPACYTGRWPHVHFEVYPDQAEHHRRRQRDRHLAGRAAAGRVRRGLRPGRLRAVGDEPGPGVACGATTSSATTPARRQLGTVTGDVTNGYAVSLTVRVDTRTTPSGGGPRPSGPPPGRCPDLPEGGRRHARRAGHS